MDGEQDSSAFGQSIKGRTAASNPTGRFEKIQLETEPSGDPEPEESAEGPETTFFRDLSRSIITTNDSPDIGFEASINPYRGCEHGCAWCYARPTHEYLGLSAGLDFESKVMVKEDAPELLDEHLGSPRYKPKVLTMSGVTDPYQPVERRLQVSRQCLEVLAEYKNPVFIITKNHLVSRDLDVLGELARHHAAAVLISLTTLDDDLRRRMEPRTASPRRRLAAIEKLSRAGVPVGVNAAPIIPGLTDHELPALLSEAAKAGASFAGYTPVRLPGAVGPLFEGWLEQNYPDRKQKVLNKIRDLHGGRLNDPRFGKRMSGEGFVADHLVQLFSVSCRRAGIEEDGFPGLSTASFHRKRVSNTQPTLFD